MLKFNEQKQLDSVNGALALRNQIEPIVDDLCAKGYDSIYFMGIGGTYASSLQVECHMKGQSSIPVYVENAAQYLTTGNLRIGEKSIVIFSSVTGSTSEMIDALKLVKAAGATVLGFVDIPNSPLSTLSDYEVVYPGNEQLKFFMTADRFMFNQGEFDDYQRYYGEMEQSLAQALIEVEKSSDERGKQIAQKHGDDIIHYFIGAGNQYGATYSYAMCYWEEQHWIKTKSIHSAEFFHGMLEVIERDTSVTVFVGEDKERPLSERVAKFLPRICSNYNIIDTKDYELKGISPEFRGSISHLVMHAVTQRIDAHLENINCHPMEIRRYYRRLDY